MNTKQQPKSSWYLKQYSMSEVKALHAAAGKFFFAKRAMTGFHTVIETVPNMANIFITSEKMEDWHKRKYTLRWFNHNTHDIEDLNGFMTYDSIEEAREARKKWTEIILIGVLNNNLKSVGGVN